MADTPSPGEAAAPGVSASAPPAADAAAAAASPPAAAAPSDAAPAADAAAVAATPSPPSLLGSADAGKRDGAPQPAADTKPAETPPPGGTEAKPDAAADAKAPETKTAAEGDKGADGKTGEVKADGAEAAAAEKDAAGKTAEGEQQPPAPPVYEAWKVPDGVTLGQTETAQYNGLLGELENARGDHAKTQEVGQKLVDFHIGEMKRLGDQLRQHQVDVWNRHIEGQINELKADPDFGGNRIETSLGNAKFVMEAMLGLSADESTKLVASMDASGISSNRLMIKALNKLYERYREPEPVPSLDPAASSLNTAKSNNPGQRGWYDKVDGVNPPPR